MPKIPRYFSIIAILIFVIIILIPRVFTFFSSDSVSEHFNECGLVDIIKTGPNGLVAEQNSTTVLGKFNGEVRCKTLFTVDKNVMPLLGRLSKAFAVVDNETGNCYLSLSRKLGLLEVEVAYSHNSEGTTVIEGSVPNWYMNISKDIYKLTTMSDSELQSYLQPLVSSGCLLED